MYRSFLFIPVITMLGFIYSFKKSTLFNGMDVKATAFNGRAPSIISDDINVYMVFALGDSILFCSSYDKGKSFSAPAVVTVLPELGLGGGRGPQIVSSKAQLIVAAADSKGNIYTFVKKKTVAGWKKGGRINDVADVAKEQFVSLASNNQGEVYAVWLDLRGDKKNKIMGASSRDAGSTWSKNKIIYRSPEGTVCECCKPSVKMKNQLVVVMFRNLLQGNRDLHIIQSLDGGINFGKAQKLGEGSWKLNGCPMDGGGLVINNDNSIETVWRREGNIYRCEAGKKEEIITAGKQCVVAGNKGSSFIAFVKEGKVCYRPANGAKVELGTGAYPQLTSINKYSAFCAWEYDAKVYYAVLNN